MKSKFLKSLLFWLLMIGFAGVGTAQSEATSLGAKIEIQSADGEAFRNTAAANVLDGNLSWASRFGNRDDPDDLFLDLGDIARIETIRVAWGRGNNRSYEFEVAARSNEAEDWSTVFHGHSSGTTHLFETYDIPDFTGQFMRIRGLSNSLGSRLTNITEVEVYGKILLPVEEIEIQSADGDAFRNTAAANVFDGNLSWASRFGSRDDPDDLFLDLGTLAHLDEIRIAWGRGNVRSYEFEVATRANEAEDWSTVFHGDSSGTTHLFETYDVIDSKAQFVRIRGLSNSLGSRFTYITEVSLLGHVFAQEEDDLPLEDEVSPEDDDSDQATDDDDTPPVDDDGNSAPDGGNTPPVDDGGNSAPDGDNTPPVDDEGNSTPNEDDTPPVDNDGISTPDGDNTPPVDDEDSSTSEEDENPSQDDLTKLEHFGEPITLVGANIPWSSDSGFSSDFGWYSPLDIASYRNRFDQLQQAGANSARVWVHTTSQVTPDINPEGFVTGLSHISSNEVVVDQLKSVLDEAWERGIVVTFSLFSFDMFCDSYGDDFGYNSYLDIERHRIMVEENYQTYIDNALNPIVTGLKDHPGLFAYEVFNEVEGAIPNMTQAGHFCSDEPNVPGDGLNFPLSLAGAQKFVNRVAAAVHELDPNVKVTTATHTDFFDAFSNETLTSQPEADPNGTLDFYELHHYAFFQNPPYITNASIYNADRPIIIGEYDLSDVQQESLFQVTGVNSISSVIDNGYAGAWPWSLINDLDGEIDAAISTVPAENRALDQAAVEACIQSQDSACYKQ